MRNDSRAFRHFAGAFEQRLQLGATNFVEAAHLLDHQLGVGFDPQGADALRFRIVQSRDQSIVFGDVVGHAANVFFQLGYDFAFRVADDDAVGGWAWIATGAAVDVGAVGGGDRLRLRALGQRTGGGAGRWRRV